ncbi:MAG: MFS transporter [Chloroflexi bacterium]|nr:MFS transporter [Chloroflexota bacterium]
MLKSARRTFNEYPHTFWVLMGAIFVDRVGGALIFPFFALYVTQKFSVQMTEVGVLFVIFSTSGMIGGFVGGALTDKFGRKWMLIFGLVMSAVSSISMALVNVLAVFYTLSFVVGLLGNTGGPAQQAMVADLLPKDKLTEGYGMMRVVANLAVAIGPAIGGLLAAKSYLLLFVIDAFTSVIAAIIVFVVLPETKPEKTEAAGEQTVLQTLAGYKVILRDKFFMAFIFMGIGMGIVYSQMYSTLSVFLRDVHGYPAQGYGFILSMNAGMVVLFQFWFTRRISGRPPILVMALGAVFYLVGFSMYGFVFTYPLFMLAMVIITIGEMLISPVGQSLVARFAPEDMRGRYMAFYGFSFAIPFAIGPLLAGIVMDNYNPNWVWYWSGIIGVFVVAGYIWLHKRAGDRLNEPSLAEYEQFTAASESSA